MVIPMSAQMLPIMNSPRIRPMKKGMAFLCVFSPPCLRINHLIMELTKIENQKTFMDQLLEMANPAGWKGHQKIRIRIIMRNRVMPNPMTIAMVAGLSGFLGVMSQL